MFVARVVQVLFQLLYWAILIRVLLSWFVQDHSHPLVRILDDITEPILAPIRRALPRGGMIDFSPIVALIAIQLVERAVLYLLVRGPF